MMNDLVGKTYRFEDGNYITVIQIKARDEGKQLVTYHIGDGGSLPRKLVMEMEEFSKTFKHLFTDNKDSQTPD
jgi:hypothetical protein